MTTQNKIAIGLSLSLVLNIFLMGNFFGPPNTDQNKESTVITEAKTDAKVIAKSVDDKGYSKTVFERQKAIVGNGDISKLPVSQSVIDSLRLDNLNKDAKLMQVDAIVATLKMEKVQAKKEVDSLKRVSYTFSDAFASGRFTPDSVSGTFDINYRIKLIRQDYYKRKWFLGAKINYVDILSPDKRITIDGLQSITIANPSPSRFGLSVTAGYAYDFASNDFRPALGLGISYQLVRF